MSKFACVSPQSLNDNVFSLIGKDWMLITAGTPQQCNTMTASWGGLGILWNKPIAIAYVRPQRYTYEFMEQADTFSLSVLPEDYREALQWCGTHSGREEDKFAASGLTVYDADGVPAVAEARLILVCRKLYAQDMKPELFVDPSLLSHYKANDFHRQYIGEVIQVLKAED
ncbi:MAG: flavin reductase family protein [Clostridia bacterium]|nr:flavin reductase family protein [Clostridia bacterium]